MTLLTRDQIVEVDDAQFEDIEVPEWGGTVRVVGMTGSQRDAYEASIIEQKGGERRVVLANARAKLVQRCLVGEDMRPLFSREDVSILGRKSAIALERVFDKARALSGMSEEDMEKLVENFDDDPNDEGTSD